MNCIKITEQRKMFPSFSELKRVRRDCAEIFKLKSEFSAFSGQSSRAHYSTNGVVQINDPILVYLLIDRSALEAQVAKQMITHPMIYKWINFKFARHTLRLPNLRDKVSVRQRRSIWAKKSIRQTLRAKSALNVEGNSQKHQSENHATVVVRTLPKEHRNTRWSF